MTGLAAGEIFWEPADDARETTQIGNYLDWLERERGLTFVDYPSLSEWSVSELEAFWQSIWDYFRIISHAPAEMVLRERVMPGADWFPGSLLNYAEHALRHEDADQVVVVAHSQTRPSIHLTRGQLRDEVARVSEGLRRLGVGPGDRVAAYVANIPEAVIGLLACASLGAIWAACPPEFGSQSVLDRIAQIEPKVLIAVDGYRYGEKVVPRLEQIAEIRAALPSLVATVVIPYLDAESGPPNGTVSWGQLREFQAPLNFLPVPFGHPLWILFSSGTTGLPKPIVHGHGGILLEHLKMSTLMQDMGPSDRYFFFSTTAWMVWNRVVSTLLTGASFVILDGDPTYPRLDALFEVVADSGVTNWGVSSAYLSICQEAGLRPAEHYDFSLLREMVAAGSPLAREAHGFVRDFVKSDVHFYSGSGGTDVCSAFVSGTPLSPVTAGEMSARMLGVLAEAWNEQGQPVVDEPGELVITLPMPSMPIGFWNDDDGSRYLSTYFDKYPGVWRHGDRFILTERGTCNILGRSDATLNRGGVRLGSGEFYTVLDAVSGVRDSLVVHLEGPAGGDLLLFVVLQDGVELDESLRLEIVDQLRRQRSPRHVPDEIYEVPDIPRTLTGKKMEVPVKRILLGDDPRDAASAAATSNPESLAFFAAMTIKRSTDVAS